MQKKMSMKLTIKCALVLLVNIVSHTAQKETKRSDADSKIRQAVIVSKDDREAADLFWKLVVLVAYFPTRTPFQRESGWYTVIPDQVKAGIVSSMAACFKQNSPALESTCPSQSEATPQNRYSRHFAGLSPLEVVACWTGKCYWHYGQQSELYVAWKDLLGRLVAMDTDSIRRLSALKWGIKSLCVDVVRLLSKDDVTKDPDLLVALVEKCRKVTEGIKKSDTGKNFTPEENLLQCELIDCNNQKQKLCRQQSAVYAIAKLLLAQKADVSGIAKMKQPHDRSCSTCKLMLDRVEEERRLDAEYDLC